MINSWLKVVDGAKRSKVDFLLDGDQYFTSIVDAIESVNAAGHYVYILAWMLDIDLPLTKSDKSRTLYNLLKERAKKGVEVRILIWDNPLPNYSDLHDKALPRLNRLPNTKAFIDPYTFFPDKSKAMIQALKPRLAELVKKYGFLLGFNTNQDYPSGWILRRLAGLMASQSLGAHHEKVVIVKGRFGKVDKLVAYCGGIDFNRNRLFSTIGQYADDPRKNAAFERAAKAGYHVGEKRKFEYRFPYYHDNACRLEGPAAYDMLQRFKQRWRNHPVATNESLLGDKEPEPSESAPPDPYAKVVGTYNSVDHRERDRSFSDAFFKIIANAKKCIYLEDQYLVNQDVARALNKKIKESAFRKLTFAIQDSIATDDILIPNRKRDEFAKALFDGVSDEQREKVLFAVIDRTYWDKERYHPAMHAKTLIVDDELAMIGSANINRRSFMIDTETSVIVFDEVPETDRRSEKNFARNLRVETWKEFLRRPTDPITYESWWNYPSMIQRDEAKFSQLIRYSKNLKEDLDVRIKEHLKNDAIFTMLALEAFEKDLNKTMAALSPRMVDHIFNTLWDHFVDPAAP